MKQQTASSQPLSPINKEVWGLKQIAHYLDRKDSSIYGLVKEPAFPRPIFGQKRYRRWLASEVIEYLLNHRQTTSLEPEVFVNSDLVTR